MSIIENCVALKMRTHERMNYKRPVRGNGHRLALFLIFARRKATNKKEVLAAFQKGLDLWKLFERKTAAYHVEKFFLSQFRDEEKSTQKIVEGVPPTRKNGYKKRRMGKSDHKTSEDGGDDNDHPIQTGGVLHA